MATMPTEEEMAELQKKSNEYQPQVKVKPPDDVENF